MKKATKDINMNYEQAFLAWIIRLEARLDALENDSHPEKQFVTPGEFETTMEMVEKRLDDLEHKTRYKIKQK
tara:strand:- start:402 stop:617 length:216 start_codon:yes stop_codon:yes gene_type:complete